MVPLYAGFIIHTRRWCGSYSAYIKEKSWCYIHFLPAENLSSLPEELLLCYIANQLVLLHEKYAVLYF